MKIRLSDFRALIPSWFFFDDVVEDRRVWVRFADKSLGALSKKPEAKLSEWELLFENRLQLSWWQIFHLPEWNRELYCRACFETLLHHSQNYLKTPSSFVCHESYLQCLAIVMERFSSRSTVQFRIGHLFISSIHEVASK